MSPFCSSSMWPSPDATRLREQNALCEAARPQTPREESSMTAPVAKAQLVIRKPVA